MTFNIDKFNKSASHLRRAKARKVNFYRKKLRGLIIHLNKINNAEISSFFKENYNEANLFSDSSIKRLIPKVSRYKEDFTVAESLYSTVGLKPHTLGCFLYKIASIVYENKELSSLKFISYLDKHSLSYFFGDSLMEFHKTLFEDALKKKSLKSLEEVYRFKYISYSLKIDIASVILERLKTSKNVSKEILERWSFNSMLEGKKVRYLKSLEFNENIEEMEYLDLMLIFAKEDSKQQVKLYIYSYLIENGELLKHLDLMKQSFQENIANTKNGKKYFNLLFKYAMETKDLNILNWMYSIYQNSSAYGTFPENSKKVVRDSIKSLKT